ncbi:Cactin, partial [Trema orientale]
SERGKKALQPETWGSHRRLHPRDRRSHYHDHDHGRKKKKSKSSSSSRKITDEEITEYIVKKALKKAMKAEKTLKSESHCGYSNDSNPFGDPTLSEPCKIERDVRQGVPLESYSTKALRRRLKENLAESHKVKKRREQTALEKAQHEEEMDWEKKEEEFHFDQSKIRSQIRLREGRIKPVDILSKILNGYIEINEPYMVFKGLRIKDMEELRDDIKMYLDLDRATPTHIEYWEALLIVCDWELVEARKKDALDRAMVRGEEPPPELLAEERGLHSSIELDVRKELEGRNYVDLDALQSRIELWMRSGEAAVVEYWEVLLKRLHIYKAKACLKEIHAKMLRRHLQRLELPVDREERFETATSSKSEEEKESDHDVHIDFNEGMQEEIHEAEDDAGSFSPELLHVNENEEAIDPEEDRAILEQKRIAVLEQQRRIQEGISNSKTAPLEDNFEMKATKAMGSMVEGDAVFGTGAEVNLDSQVYWWHDKCRPRKPKYFNRIHSGYEWNKYNQTHYDHDNPPPKMVQGYKFNIFYPDLVDRTKAPIYTTEKDGNNSETCIIRFLAGPPYEDIAFRIVNKEWEYSHKKGFKCTFERGILHVYFNFKRHCYRR